MRKLTRNTLAAAAVMAAAVSLTTTSARADDVTFTVSGGTSISGTNYQLPVVARDVQTGAAASCDTGSATGTVKNGSGLSGAGLGSLTSVSLTDSSTPDGACLGPSGITLKLDLQGLPWAFNAVSYNSATGVTSGNLSNVKATLTGSDDCVAHITGPGGGFGQIEGTYTNPATAGDPALLGVTTSNLTIADVNEFCDPNLINQGDTIELDGKFEITPKLTITSP
ncbi:hypothetical protein J4573_12770 [Actinomadura barringtoniae]|uniref:Secreted protein n=1 Tax=Actinomadura barringtoniae TaxID=1427535 RepID=A0A939T4B7_9ACTN|nr:hypothetical protein [Actinomadura barringtoniae]MBO2447969.1 hypothetical protein [Actinomadura barringtoniae]